MNAAARATSSGKPVPSGCMAAIRDHCSSLMREPEGTLADVAATAGYFDQAHFI